MSDFAVPLIIGIPACIAIFLLTRLTKKHNQGKLSPLQAKRNFLGSCILLAPCVVYISYISFLGPLVEDFSSFFSRVSARWSTDSTLAGTWKSDEASGTLISEKNTVMIRLSKDGTAHIENFWTGKILGVTSNESQSAYDGKWKVKKDKLTFTSEEGEQIFEVIAVTRDSLTLKPENTSQPALLHRIGDAR